MNGRHSQWICLCNRERWRESKRERERAEAAEVGERREKGTCAWE